MIFFVSDSHHYTVVWLKQSVFSILITDDEHLCVFSASGFKTQGAGVPVWRGGETEALERLNKHLDRKVNPKKQ